MGNRTCSAAVPRRADRVLGKFTGAPGAVDSGGFGKTGRPEALGADPAGRAGTVFRSAFGIPDGLFRIPGRFPQPFRSKKRAFRRPADPPDVFSAPLFRVCSDFFHRVFPNLLKTPFPKPRVFHSLWKQVLINVKTRVWKSWGKLLFYVADSHTIAILRISCTMPNN